MTIVFKYFIIVILSSAFTFSQNDLKLKKDKAQVTEDESIKIDVLKNDGIKDKSNLIIKIEKQAQKGVAVLSGNMIEYTPNSNESGSDNFTYSVDVGTGFGSAEVSVKIKSVNDEPTGLSLSNKTIRENKPEGTLIGKLIVDDPDMNDTFNFGLSRDSKADFRIDGKKLLSKDHLILKSKANMIYRYKYQTQQVNLMYLILLLILKMKMKLETYRG